MTKPAEPEAGGLLAIHLGENVGYCYGDRPSTWILPKNQDDGYVGGALFDALSDFWRVVAKPDRIVLSDSLDEIIDNTDAARAKATLQVGLIMVIRVFGLRRNVIVEPVHPDVVRKTIFERDDMPKKTLRAAVNGLAKRRGYPTLDPNAADALVLYEYATRVRATA